MWCLINLNIKKGMKRGEKSMNFIVELLAKIGVGAANVGTQACSFWFIDEPKMPKSLLNK